MTSICSTVQHAITFCDWPISWSATGDFLSGVGTLVGAIAVFRAADAFKLWRQQKISERHMLQAERILTALYEAQDAMVYARSHFMNQYEINTAKEEVAKEQGWNGWSEEKQRRVAFAQAKLNRLKQTRDKQRELVNCLPMAKALFGDQVHKAVSDYHHQFWVLQTYLEAYCHDEHGNDADFTRKISEAMAAGEDATQDEISAKLVAAREMLEITCLPLLRLEKPRPRFIFRYWKVKDK